MFKMLAATVVFALGIAAAPAVAQPRVDVGPLGQYVEKPDASYGWETRREGKLGATDYVELTLTSQTWRGTPWRHQLFLLRPSTTPEHAKHGLLFIAGGVWRDELARAPQEAGLPHEARLVAAVAEQLKTPVAVLFQVPHQPLFGGMVEDQIIAYTFEKYLQTGESDWPLLLPMVKSAVRAMDATQECAGKQWQLPLETFTVTGASKRGWTTWLTGAVDARVTALAPMVIDVLNMPEQMEHQRETWGEYSREIDDYTKRGLQQRIASDTGRGLVRIVDPFSYRRLLTQPKLILISANDPYWPLDALNLYWDELAGPKYVLYLPNQGHAPRDFSRIFGAIAALHQQAAGGEALPKISWAFTQAGERLALRVESDQKPRAVRVWTATSPTRDFRQARWTSRPLRADEGCYDFELPAPGEGYAALFAEAEYQNGGLPFHLSTNVRVLPPVGGDR